MKCIIVYQSKTGFTKKYAMWILEKLHCDIMKLKDATKEKLTAYDCIIFGSYIRVEKVRGWNKMKALAGKKENKDLIIFATGSTPVAMEEHINDIWKKSIPEKQLQDIPHFYMQSGLNYEKMGVADKLMMKGFAVMMKWKNKKDGKVGAQDLGKSFDNSSKKFIMPLVNYVEKK
ncbi:MAG: flavodoxin domain-containing protein [bacterium]|nr:flavodoxin domain-containing protein [bacterium]